jgi:hypothetical protein
MKPIFQSIRIFRSFGKTFLISACLCFSFRAFTLAEDRLHYGINMDSDEKGFQTLYSSTNLIASVIQENRIEYFRFPGGTPERTYFWDNPSLMPQAYALYANFMKKRTFEGDEITNELQSRHLERSERLAKGDGSKTDQKGFENFIAFSKANKTIPVIQQNVFASHDDKEAFGVVNEDGSINEAKWPAIIANIKQEVQFAHSLYDKDNDNPIIYWEIGNEETHIYSAKTYGTIAARFATATKELYPNDKVIIQFSNPNNKKVPENWSRDVLNILNQEHASQYINYIAPHYYSAFRDVVSTNDKEIAKRIKKVGIYDDSKLYQTLLTKYPAIQIFYTEFAVFQKSLAVAGKSKDDSPHPNYNTQLHGLLMIAYLMQFNAGERMEGILHMSFAQCFNEENYKPLDQGIKPFGLYKEIPPETKVTQIFFNQNPVKARVFENKDNYCYTVSDLPDGVMLNFLNFSSAPINVSIKTLAGSVATGEISSSVYTFDNLNSKKWDATPHSLENVHDSVSLAKNSYTIIKFKK